MATQPHAAGDGDASARARRARAFAALAKQRVANSWLRFAASIIVACVALSILGHIGPVIWLAAITPLLFVERTVHLNLYKRCASGDPPARMAGLVAWTAFQSAANNAMAVMLWFAPLDHGETIAIIFIMGGLANAAATLRGSTALALAGAVPTISTLLGLPIANFMLHGVRDSLDLTPLIAGLLFLAFGLNLWRGLQASDVAQAEAEAAALRERQAAAAAATAKSDTIKRMNDELRTPMAALVGAAEHLRRWAAAPEARAHIVALVQASEVLKVVLDDLSDLDRLENGQIRIEPKATDARELVRAVAGAFRVAAEDKNLELFVDVTPEVPSLVEIDPLRVRQILFNLIDNAVRFTAYGGVRVRLQAQACGVEDMVRLGFVVADTGAGMSRSQLAVVLGRARVSEEGKGPGLGLSISLRLARLMGGQLGAKSEIGQGSVFSFVLEAPVVAMTGRSAA